MFVHGPFFFQNELFQSYNVMNNFHHGTTTIIATDVGLLANVPTMSMILDSIVVVRGGEGGGASGEPQEHCRGWEGQVL